MKIIFVNFLCKISLNFKSIYMKSQKPIRKFKILFLIAAFPLLLSAQNGETAFNTNCAACHSIGGGKLVGPDLKGITQKRDKVWFGLFVKNSAQLISSGDADAIAIAKEYNNMPMPPSALSDADIEAIYKFVQTKSGGSTTPTVAVDYLKDSKVENIKSGYKLFTGEKPFKNSGVSCISCHNVDQYGSGGKLAKNLTVSFNTIGADGIKAMMASPAFPAMINSYKNNALTEEEVFNLTSYLRATATNKLPADINKVASLRFNFYIYSTVGFSAFCLFFFINYRTRKRGSVNDEIMNRQLKTTI